MSLVALLASAAVAAPAAPPMISPERLEQALAECRRPAQPVRRGVEGRPQKLGELPQADLILPVHREFMGCPIPTVVRENVRGDGRFANPERRRP